MKLPDPSEIKVANEVRLSQVSLTLHPTESDPKFTQVALHVRVGVVSEEGKFESFEERELIRQYISGIRQFIESQPDNFTEEQKTKAAELSAQADSLILAIQAMGDELIDFLVSIKYPFPQPLKAVVRVKEA